jgi:MFS family permease
MIVAGVGNGLVFTPVISLLVGWFPKRRGFVAGSLIGPGLAGWMIDRLHGFHWAYLFAALMVIR